LREDFCAIEKRVQNRKGRKRVVKKGVEKKSLLNAGESVGWCLDNGIGPIQNQNLIPLPPQLGFDFPENNIVSCRCGAQSSKV